MREEYGDNDVDIVDIDAKSKQAPSSCKREREEEEEERYTSVEYATKKATRVYKYDTQQRCDRFGEEQFCYNIVKGHS
jgi:hypothetical protein